MKKNGFLISCCLCLATGGLSYGQSFVNMTWNQAYGQPDTIDWMATCLDTEDNIIITGNKKATGGNTNVYTAKYDTDGNLLWTKQYSYTSAQKDYGVAVTTDGNNNIYIAGTSYINSTNGYDFTVIMYDEDGNEDWVSNYNGTGSGDDIATAIAEYDGDVFVTGISKGDTTLEDYVTIKYNSSGVQQWVSRYDYTNLVEIPAAIQIYDNGNVLITGASGCSIFNWDITTVLYNNSTGNQISSRRVTGSGYGFNQPADMRKDYLGNIIITGKVLNQQNNYDIKTIKMDANLDTIWTRTYNRDSLDDVPAAMDVDVNGKIYITGYSNKASGSDMLNLQYDTNGNLTWSHIVSSTQTSGIAKGKQIKVDIYGNFYATGEIDRDSTIDIVTLRYDTARTLCWVKYFNGNGNGTDRPWDMICSHNGNAWVSGISYDGATETYTTIKYSTLKLDHEAATDTLGNPLFVKNQIIVAFDTSVVNKQNIDDLDIQWGDAEYFLKDTVIDVMNEVLPDGIVNNAKFIRIFKDMTTADSLSVTRLGDTINVHPFWATLLMTLNDEDIEFSATDTLNSFYPIIQYSHINAIGKVDDVPNDDLVSTQQESLIPTTTYPDAHINMEAGWDIEVGQPYVRVGVYDYPIYWAHEDFGDGTFPGSKIIDGKDYSSGQEISGVLSVSNSHGTSVAGIIGALRNNNKGIAGIAGGNIDDDNNPGVSLYSLGIVADSWIPMSTVSDAIVKGALDGTNNGYGLNIQNHSWGVEIGTTYYSHTVNANDFNLLKDAADDCYKNNCILVASRGNDGDTDLKYPSCFADNKVISVGASGYDGAYHDGNHGDWWWVSSYGNNVDIVAPGVTQIVAAPYYYDEPYNWGSCAITGTKYTCFNGTSSAAPHVAGVAALMYSHHNVLNGYSYNLAPEDIENIIQKNATDKGTSGYDNYNGWGLLNAGEALKYVSGKYSVFHSGSGVKSQTTSANIQIVLPYNINGLSAASYIADRVQITETFLDILDQDIQVIDKWSRFSSTVGVSAANPVSGETWADFAYVIQNNVVAVTATTFCWHVTQQVGGGSKDVWIPRPPSDIKTAYSLHLYDPNWVDIEKLNNNLVFKLYPNPSNEIIKIEYKNDRPQMAIIEIYSVTGKLVLPKQTKKSTKGIVPIDVSAYSPGLYFVKFVSGDIVKTEKFIKN